MAEETEHDRKVTKPYSVFSQDEDTNSLKSIDETIQEWTAKPDDYGLSANTRKQLIELTHAVNKQVTEGCEFSSLAYISKRLNQDNGPKNYTFTAVEDISKELEDAQKFTETKDRVASNEPETTLNMSNEECLGYISVRTQNLEADEFLAIDNTHSECIKALQRIHSNITGKALIVDKDENIHLCFNLELDEDRELMVALTKTKLPEIYTLKITNFYESDEDLENFLMNSLSTVTNLVFHSESYCVDFHDYLEKLMSISSITHLYLKGFLIDSEDTERLLANSNAQKITFESCNIAVDDEFSIESQNNNGVFNSLLKSIAFIDNEMDEESMTRMLKAIKDSELDSTVTDVQVNDCWLSQEQVDSIIKC